ncbi:hypothetical protein [Tabrizicola sp.]|uniref:hypothetical protein n=1 Tax=Tabrizicola sp. TaxID=2005166 RepID=UPI002FDCA42F
MQRIGPWQDHLDRLLAVNGGKSARERLTLIRIFEELRALAEFVGENNRLIGAPLWKKGAALSQLIPGLPSAPVRSWDFSGLRACSSACGQNGFWSATLQMSRRPNHVRIE